MINMLSLKQLVTEEFKSAQRGVKKYTHTGLDVTEWQKKEFRKSVNRDQSFRHFSMTKF